MSINNNTSYFVSLGRIDYRKSFTFSCANCTNWHQSLCTNLLKLDTEKSLPKSSILELFGAYKQEKINFLFSKNSQSFHLFRYMAFYLLLSCSLCLSFSTIFFSNAFELSLPESLIESKLLFFFCLTLIVKRSIEPNSHTHPDAYIIVHQDLAQMGKTLQSTFDN